ncbi:MAG: beta-ketothiolase BktB [Hasllibacter sp.]
MKEIHVISAARTAIGTFGGALATVPPCDLGAAVATAAIERAGIAPSAIGQTAFGTVIQTEPRDMYLSRVAAMGAGVPETAPAMNVNRLCGSGLQAVLSMVQAIECGHAEVALAGGAESMSRAPFALPGVRFGTKMGDARAVDMMLGALNCPFGTGHMGVTAENVAEAHGVSRADQDAFALRSQERAAAAIAEGRFADQIVPVEVKGRKGAVIFDTDEHPKPSTAEGLAALRPAFQKDGTVTAGNASGINDGAAALVLAVPGHGEPLARIVGYGLGGVGPRVMGLGPIPACRDLFERTGLGPDDFDVIESNEAFAAQAIAVTRELGFDPERVNPNGGAIALGHPVGASGAIILTKAIHELRRAGGRRALATMCIGGGQGIAVAVEAP